MVDTQETIHDTIKELDDFLKCSDEEKEQYKDKDWTTPSIREWIFYREGMTPEEFEEEYNHYWKYVSEGRINEYKPLHKELKVSNESCI